MQSGVRPMANSDHQYGYIEHAAHLVQAVSTTRSGLPLAISLSPLRSHSGVACATSTAAPFGPWPGLLHGNLKRSNVMRRPPLQRYSLRPTPATRINPHSRPPAPPPPPPSVPPAAAPHTATCLHTWIRARSSHSGGFGSQARLLTDAIHAPQRLAHRCQLLLTQPSSPAGPPALPAPLLHHSQPSRQRLPALPAAGQLCKLRQPVVHRGLHIGPKHLHSCHTHKLQFTPSTCWTSDARCIILPYFPCKFDHEDWYAKPCAWQLLARQATTSHAGSARGTCMTVLHDVLLTGKSHADLIST